MGTKLFVGGLSWGTTDVSLQAAFEQYGEVVESRVILDRETGRSRGFGFVTFSKEEETAAAEQGMNGAMLDGRTVRVNVAEDRRGGGGPGGPPRGRPGGHRAPPEVHTRGRPTGGRPPHRGARPAAGRSGPPGGGRPGGPGRGPPSGGGPGGGWNARGAGGFGGKSSTDAEETGWSEDRRKADHTRKKKKKDGPREQEGYDVRPTERRTKRESGRTWRDYAGDDEEDDWEF